MVFGVFIRFLDSCLGCNNTFCILAISNSNEKNEMIVKRFPCGFEEGIHNMDSIYKTLV